MADQALPPQAEGSAAGATVSGATFMGGRPRWVAWCASTGWVKRVAKVLRHLAYGAGVGVATPGRAARPLGARQASWRFEESCAACAPATPSRDHLLDLLT